MARALRRALPNCPNGPKHEVKDLQAIVPGLMDKSSELLVLPGCPPHPPRATAQPKHSPDSPLL